MNDDRGMVVKKRVERNDGRMMRKINVIGEGIMKRGREEGKERGKKEGGRGKFGSTGHRNISLSIRRKTRRTPCLTAASFKESEILNLAFIICILFKYVCVNLSISK